MILADLINTKTNAIAKEQLRHWHIGLTNAEIESVISKLSLSKNWGNIKEVIDFINNHDALSSNEELNFYIQYVHGITHPEYSSVRASQIRKKMQAEPENMLLVYFWIYSYLLEIKDEEAPAELPFFLDEIIGKYPALINLDDFLENSIVLQLNEEAVKVSPKLYMHLFEKASKKYPNKKSFRHYLAMSHLYNGDLEPAIDTLIYLHNWMLDLFTDYQNDNIEDNYIFYHYSNLVKGVIEFFEESSEYNKVIDIAEMVQSVYFSKFKETDPNRYTYADFFIELSFRKMRAFLHFKKIAELKNEFKQIQPYLKDAESEFWKTEFVDVISVC